MQRVDTLEIFIGEGEGRHPWPKKDGVHLLHHPQVLLSSRIRVALSRKALNNGIDDLSVTPSSTSIVSATLGSTIIFVCPSRVVIPSPDCLLPSRRRSLRTHASPLHVLTEMPDLD